MNLRTGVLTVVGLGTLFFIYLPTKVKAQIVPDQTLPDNSIVNQRGSTSLIEGGTIRRGNLFHSFETFSVPTGGTAYFNNSVTTQNIISRVTGGSISNIDGLLKANSTANLFLINSSGIIFGPNASLDLGGSFFGTTANTVKFADGFELSTDDKSPPPLLSIKTPIGLRFGGEPGTIRVEGTGADLTSGLVFPSLIRQSYSSGLQVLSGKTLGLIGGEVNLDGGILTALGGRVELGAVSNGQISFNPNLSGSAFNYDAVASSGGIQLSKNSLVDVSGASSGSIQLQGDDVALRSGSHLWSQNSGPGLGGSISLSSSKLTLEGIWRDGRISTAIVSDALGSGNGSNINISTVQLDVGGGAAILSSNLGTGKGGDITVNASKFVDLAGFAQDVTRVSSGIGAFNYGLGSGGDLKLTTGKLTVSNQATLNTVTYGPAQGGNSTLAAQEFLVSEGGSVGTFTFSSGKGGNQTIAADTVELVGETPTILSPSVINAASFGSGDAGDLIIETKQLAVKKGARVDTAGLGGGSAGNVTINASDSVEVSGVGPTTGTPSSIDSSVSILSKSLQEFFNLPPIPTGDSGNATITTKKLSVRDDGQISARNDGPGAGGTIQIKAEVINLGKQGSITSATAGGDGGNVQIQVQDLLRLQNGSNITANAQGTGIGGNITINSSLLLALENSDITANAQEASGGRVVINSQGIFGTEFRDRLTPESDITATSELGPQFSGTVEINTPDVDFAKATAPPVIPPESPQVSSTCQARSSSEASSLTSPGAGGLPAAPSDPISSSTGWNDNTPLSQEDLTNNPQFVRTTNNSAKFVEAQGWVSNPDGTMSMTTVPTEVTPYSSLSTPTCQKGSHSTNSTATD